MLGKVDVDAHPRLAQAFRVQGIPMVFAVVGGQPVEGFTGVLPEAQVRQYIDAVLKAGGVAVDAPEDPRLDAADDALMIGDLDEAEAAYKKILAETPQDARGRGRPGPGRAVPPGRPGSTRPPRWPRPPRTPTTSPHSGSPRTSRCSAGRPTRRTAAGRSGQAHQR